MRQIGYFISVFFIIIFTFSCTMPKFNPETTQTVQKLDLERYMGKWYEIYRLPMRAENDLVNVTATYNLRSDHRVDVINSGYKFSPDGKFKKAKALAWRPNEKVPGALIVRFFGLFRAEYLVLALDEQYQWAIVSNSKRKYAWILARSPELPDDLEQDLLDSAASFGIDTARFIKTTQQW